MDTRVPVYPMHDAETAEVQELCLIGFIPFSGF